MVWGYSGETASEGLSPQQVGGGDSGGCRTFVLPPYGRHVVSPGEDCAFTHNYFLYTIVVQDTAWHI